MRIKLKDVGRMVFLNIAESIEDNEEIDLEEFFVAAFIAGFMYNESLNNDDCEFNANEEQLEIPFH